jgi:putative acetyltransferase
LAKLHIAIRSERPADHAHIHTLTALAFARMTFSDGTEPAIINALRAAGDLTVSLVASISGRIVGHVAFSPAMIAGAHESWFALGPIAVHPQHQRQGIGSALIEAGLERLRTMGAQGCVLIGDPGYYARFGFQGDGRLTYGGLAPSLVQGLAFAGNEVPQGMLAFAPAFDLETLP